MFVLRHIGAGTPLRERVRLAVGFIGEGRRAMDAMFENHWRTADALTDRLGLSQVVRDSVGQTFERWDGKGEPDGAKGTATLLPSRLVNLADVVEVFHQAGGLDAAIAVARARSGTQFDPELVELFASEAADVFDELDSITSWDGVMASEPGLGVELEAGEFDAALEALADFVDLKSPYTLGHSRGVADLAGGAAGVAALPESDATSVRRAALVHDLGRLGVSNSIWDKEGELTYAEVERVRLHPYFTERMLASAPALAPLAALAIQHHERLDGSGYPRGLSVMPSAAAPDPRGGGHVPVEDRTTAHRPAQPPDEVAKTLRAEVRAGRLDGDAVDAVLRGRRAPGQATARVASRIDES